MGFAKTVAKTHQRAKKAKAYFDEICEGISLSDPRRLFCVTVFLPMMDKISCQLINCFEGMKSVVTSYQVLESGFLSNASHLNLEVEARKFFENISPLFPSQMLSIESSFREKIAHLKSAEERVSFLIVENASLATTYSDVCMAYKHLIQTCTSNTL